MKFNTLIYYTTLACGLFIYSSCATNNQTAKSKKSNSNIPKMSEKYKEVATQKFTENITYLFNKNKTCVLCLKDDKGTAKRPQNDLRFFAYDLTKEAIIYEKSVGAGTVSWFDDEHIAIFYLPGIMGNDQTQDDYTTLYNIKTKKEISKKEFLPNKSQTKH